jgi:hypothetical protein
MEFDSEAFIYEIQWRRTIWDVASDNYSDKEKKNKA